MKLETQNPDGTWDDLTAYVEQGSLRLLAEVQGQQPIPHLGRSLRAKVAKPMGPRTKQRLIAYSVRVKSLPLLRDTYGPSANPTVALARAATRTSALDRALLKKQGRGGRGPTPPNRRLATFGMRVVLDDHAPDGYRLVGGTARQQRCYRRAVDRWLVSDPIPKAAAL